MKHWITQAPIPGSELQKTLMGKQRELKTSLNDSGCPEQEGFPKSSHQQAKEKFPLLKSVLFPEGEKYQLSATSAAAWGYLLLQSSRSRAVRDTGSESTHIDETL